MKKAAELAELAAAGGGRAFFVGGFVRDRLLGLECKDVDVEIHGITENALKGILEQLGEPLSYGSSFGIWSLSGCDMDIALPRSERKTGEGHRDFDVTVDPFIGYEKAAERRDFTVNALMEDVLTGEILDFFGGKRDLEGRVLRHVSDSTFSEDPLRVLRGAQFAARFGMTVCPGTMALCSSIDLTSLPKERIEEEMKKALLKAPRPSVFFDTLREMGQLDAWFPELKMLIGVRQDPLYHPEGDVWIHTMQVLDRAAAVRERSSDPYFFMMLALTHDFGKCLTTEEKDGRIHAYGHETEGMPMVMSFVKRITDRRDLADYLENMVPLHMKPNMLANSKASVKSTNRFFDGAASPEDQILFSGCDRPTMVGNEKFFWDPSFLEERLKIYRQTMAEPFVSGKDLVEAGLEPGERFSSIMEYAHKLRLAGIPKETALKQVLAFARKQQ
ncbi:MAG: tRNA nucleotidyltransferase, partial [Eubacteriales bacterium]|nr:tRNA nucleotidyltransferase [Eubacteriales bacterium]